MSDVQSADSFSSKVSTNMVVNLARTVIMALIGFMMVPYYIGEFGIATYALLPLATSVTTYFIVISDSLSNAFTRYMGIAIQKGDYEGANRIYTTSLLGMCRVLVVILPIVALVSWVSPYVFNIGPSSALDVQLMFFMVLVSSLMISLASCVGSVYMAYNKMYITNASRIIQCVSQALIVLIVFFAIGPSLTTIGISYIVSAVLMMGFMLLYLRRVCPTLRFSRRLYDGKLLKEMGGLGLWAIVSEIGGLMFIQASLIVVNLLIGSTMQGLFSITANMISMIHTATTSIAVVSVPLAYRFYANKDSEGMVGMLKLFSKFVGIMLAFPLAYIMVFAPQVLGIWLGPGYGDIIPLLYIMLPVEVTLATVSSLMQIPVVYNRVRWVAITTLAIGVFNIVLATVLLQFTDLGLVGVSISWSVSMLMLKLVFYPLYCRRLAGGSLKDYYAPVAINYCVFLSLLAIGWVVTSSFTLPTTWFAVLTSFLVGFVVYFVLMLRFMFTKDERGTICTYLPKAVQRFIKV